MNFGPECKTRISAAHLSFGSKAKMSIFSPNIFPTFYQFPGRFSLTLQHIKNLEVRFSVSANYHRFWLLTWSKMKNFAFFYKMPFNSFSKRINLAFMFYVKIFDFWPCQKLKSVIICRNGKSTLQIFYMLQSKWKSTRKLIKSWKNVGGKSTHFCLGPKTWTGCRDPRFTLRSKIHVFGSTF